MASSRCKKITLYISLFVLFGITFGFLMGFVYTTAQDRRAYTEGICTVKNLDIVASRCCKIQDCKCEECPFEAAPTCQKRLVNLTVGTCCGEPKCCKECCSCTRRNEPNELGPLLERGIGQDMNQSMARGLEERAKGSPVSLHHCALRPPHASYYCVSRGTKDLEAVQGTLGKRGSIKEGEV